MKFLCPTPKDKCCGALTITNQTLRKTIPTHGSSEECFKCYVAYLIKKGYTQIASREFRPPDGGPILLLNKKSKFGLLLRLGKRGEGGSVKGSRFVPRSKRAGVIIGV